MTIMLIMCENIGKKKHVGYPGRNSVKRLEHVPFYEAMMVVL